MRKETLAYLAKPGEKPVKPASQEISAGPAKSAVESGRANQNFQVYVRVRPLLPREERGAVWL